MRTISEQGDKNADGEPTQKIPSRKSYNINNLYFGVGVDELTKAFATPLFQSCLDTGAMGRGGKHDGVLASIVWSEKIKKNFLIDRR